MQTGAPMSTPFRLPRPLLILLLALMALSAPAQVFFEITDSTVTTCSGALLDSGGQGASGYGNNESHTLVICPDAADVGISLNFVTFQLSGAGSAPYDHLQVYDGNDTSAPLLGDYDINNPLGIVSASWENTSGCLTLVFQSNETGTGVFAAAITCYEPCQPPTAVGTMSEAAPALVCQNEVVSFNGSGSYSDAGYGISQWIWTFDDGTVDSTSGPSVQHSFSIPGEYVVELQVEDDNGCMNTNPVELQILVSTTPQLEGFANQTICVGETALLTPSVVQGTTWTGMPQVDFGDGVYLPDELGVPFTSSVNFNAFAPGQTLNNINDLLSICVSMEHSFMGDFVMQITSPSGQTVVLHQQGGGGTFLGIPVDDDSQPDVPGTCWEYCFTPNATAGTWAQNGNGGTLPSGDYNSVQPLTGLLGSPLNGTWTLTFTDLWGSDNGFMCAWSLSLNPALIPDATVYTPVLGVNSPDSVSWTGPFVTPNAGNPTHASAAPNAPGSYNYQFQVTDNFGCTYDTSLVVTVTPGAQFSVYATPPAICGNPIQLGVQFQLPMPNGLLTYNWGPTGSGLSSLTSPFPNASPTAPTWYHLTVFPVGHPLCGMTDSIHLNPLTTLELDTLVVDPLCHGDGTGRIELTATGNGGPWDIEWQHNGLVIQSLTEVTGDVLHAGGGLYQVTVREGVNGNGCYDSLLVTIHEPDLLQMDWITPDTTICLTGTAELMTSTVGGTAPVQVVWEQGMMGIGPHPVSPTTGTHPYQAHATDAHGCMSDTANTQVVVRPGLQFGLPDTLSVCPDLDEPLAVSALQGGDSVYHYAWTSSPSNTPGILVSSAVSQEVCVTVSDGCETPPLSACTWFAVRPMPPLIVTADTLEGCPGLAVHFTLEDTTTAGAIVDWYFGESFPALGVAPQRWYTYHHPGDFTVQARVLWPNGCYDDTTITHMVHIEAVPDADFSWGPKDVDILWPRVTFTDASGPHAVRWHWELLNGDTMDVPQFQYTFPGEVGGVYPVRLIAYNYLGCADTVVRPVEINDLFEIFLPSAFSPDGDGLNDQLHLFGRDLSTSDFEWSIFDRWGTMIFNTTSTTDGWNGQVNGKNAMPGVYAWLITARSAYSGKDYELRGHVTLLR